MKWHCIVSAQLWKSVHGYILTNWHQNAWLTTTAYDQTTTQPRPHPQLLTYSYDHAFYCNLSACRWHQLHNPALDLTRPHLSMTSPPIYFTLCPSACVPTDWYTACLQLPYTSTLPFLVIQPADWNPCFLTMCNHQPDDRYIITYVKSEYS